MKKDLEKIILGREPSGVEPENLTQAYRLIAQGQRRSRTKTPWGLISATRSLDKARSLLEKIAEQTIIPTDTTSPPTHHATNAVVLLHYMDYQIAVERGNYEQALDSIDEMGRVVTTRMPTNKKLMTFVALEKARVNQLKGSYVTAIDHLSTPTLPNLAYNPKALEARGDIKFEQGDYGEAEKEYRQLYNRLRTTDPKRKEIGNKLADIYQELADLTADPKEDTTSIDPDVVKNWKAALDLLNRDGFTGQKEAFQQVITGIEDPVAAGDTNKLELLARAYHGLASANRRGGDNNSALTNLYKSIEILPTPKAYLALAEVHRVIASQRNYMGR